MKHFTDKIQTQKLKGMGFPVPVLAGVDAEVRGDLVDRLYDICVGLRGEGII